MVRLLILALTVVGVAPLVAQSLNLAGTAVDAIAAHGKPRPAPDPSVIPANGARYRVSVEIVVDDRKFVASAVQQVEVNDQGIFAGFGGTPSYTVRHHGEAPFLELPSGLTLVALMLNPEVDAYRHALWHCLTRPDGQTVKEFIATLHSFRGSCGFPEKNFPVLVSISDPAVVESMKVLGGNSAVKNPEPSSARVVRAWIETTDEPVTRTIKAQLPFLNDPDLGSRMLDMRLYKRHGISFGAPWSHP